MIIFKTYFLSNCKTYNKILLTACYISNRFLGDANIAGVQKLVWEPMPYGSYLSVLPVPNLSPYSSPIHCWSMTQVYPISIIHHSEGPLCIGISLCDDFPNLSFLLLPWKLAPLSHSHYIIYSWDLSSGNDPKSVPRFSNRISITLLTNKLSSYSGDLVR